MKKIYRYEIPLKDQFTLKIPADGEILHVGEKDGVPNIWININDEHEWDNRLFFVYATGEPIERDDLKYIGTFQDKKNPDFTFIWHLFEKI